MIEIATPPPELDGGAPRVLRTFDTPAVSSVLHGNLEDDVRRVRDSSQVPDGIRAFLTRSMPPLPQLWWEGAHDDHAPGGRLRTPARAGRPGGGRRARDAVPADVLGLVPTRAGTGLIP